MQIRWWLTSVLIACASDDSKGVGTKEIDTAGIEVTDLDGDGYFSDEDCDNIDSAPYPGGVEVCDDIDLLVLG